MVDIVDLSTDSRRNRALAFVSFERERQERLKASGKFTHTCADSEMDDLARLVVLVEEVGEVAQAINEGHEVWDLRAELVQVAAVAVAWVEGLDGVE